MEPKMEPKHDDGGPAFPLKNYTSEIGPDLAGFMAKGANGEGPPFWVNAGAPGMSLLDWFAGHATPFNLDGRTEPAIRAHMRYEEAGAMLAEKRRREADDASVPRDL